MLRRSCGAPSTARWPTFWTRLDGRWTFQLVEEFDDVYYGPVKRVEAWILDQLLAGRAMSTNPN